MRGAQRRPRARGRCRSTRTSSSNTAAHSLLMARFCARVRAARAVAAGRHARRLRPYDDPPARPRARRAKAGRDGRPRPRAGLPAVEPRLLRLRRRADGVLRRSSARSLSRPASWRSTGSTRPSTRRSRSTDGRCSSPPSWFFGHNALAVAAQVAARRPRPRRRHPAVEHRLFPLLGGEGHRALGARHRLRRNAALQCSICACSARGSGATRSSLSRIVPSHRRPFRGRRGRARHAQRAPAGLYGRTATVSTRDAIRIGRNAYVGEQSVLDIGSTIGDFGQLGHASSLQSGQRVPDGKRYAGSPAEETTTNFRLADEATARSMRRGLFTAMRLAFVIAVAGALTEAVVIYAMSVLTGGDDALALESLGCDRHGSADGRWRGARASRSSRSLAACWSYYAVPRLAAAFPGRGSGLSALRLPSRDAADRARSSATRGSST